MCLARIQASLVFPWHFVIHESGFDLFHESLFNLDYSTLLNEHSRAKNLDLPNDFFLHMAQSQTLVRTPVPSKVSRYRG